MTDWTRSRYRLRHEPSKLKGIEMMRYVNGGMIPKSVGPGRVLMHNHVRHGIGWGCGINGFRAWTDNKPPAGFVLCPCGWAVKRHVAAWRDPSHRRRMQRWVRAEERRILDWIAGKGPPPD
jgi:hypothetical protein